MVKNMAHNDFKYKGNLPVNFEQKCSLILVLDISGSMAGKPLDELNIGLKAFQEEICKDITASSKLDISIITFGTDIRVVQDFASINEFEMPNLTSYGSTKMVDGMKKAFEALEARKIWYKETGQLYYRPYVVLITDGYPDADQDIKWLKNEINSSFKAKKLNFWGFGVEGADMSLLKDISHDGSLIQKLKGLEFVKFFNWLSASMTSISGSTDGDFVDMSPESEEKNPFQIKI